jgi:hypothetical protein
MQRRHGEREEEQKAEERVERTRTEVKKKTPLVAFPGDRFEKK